MLNEDSIEPSYEVVKEVILGIGFVFEVSLVTKFHYVWYKNGLGTRVTSQSDTLNFDW